VKRERLDVKRMKQENSSEPLISLETFYVSRFTFHVSCLLNVVLASLKA